MINENVLFGLNAKKEIKIGIDIVSDAVKSTLGPQGKNVIIDKYNGSPHITKDGVTIAKEIILKEKYQSMGARLIQDVADKTCQEVGDATTTSVVLAQAIIKEGLNVLQNGSVNPTDLRKGIEKASQIVTDFISKSSISLDDDIKMVKDVATISANNDEYLGDIISNAISMVGKYGAVRVESSNNNETYLKTVEGFNIKERGYLSPYFITNDATQECILEGVVIYITDDKIEKSIDAISILNNFAALMKNNKNIKSLLVIAEDVTGEAFSTFVINKVQGDLNLCVIKGPEFGQNRKDSMEDIAILTNGGVDSIIKKEGKFGYAEKVIVGKDSTIVYCKNQNDRVLQRINILKSLISASKNEFDSNLLKERLSRFSDGVATIYVGAKTEIELKEKMDRIDDALCATRAALEEGVVPGGGVVFLKAKVELLKNKTLFSDNEKAGWNVINEALQAPISQLLINADLPTTEIVEEILSKRTLNYGYNAKSGRYGNLIKFGVIDPAKSLKVSFQNAVSISTLFLTTECAISCV